MGILNITPDSFFDGGKFSSDTKVLEQTEKMIQEGALIIDIGGVSTRPGAEEVSAEEEIKRVVPVIQSIQKEFPDTILSLDTFRSKVAQTAYEHGVSMDKMVFGNSFWIA
jgi:dihydropteroate synthase